MAAKRWPGPPPEPTGSEIIDMLRSAIQSERDSYIELDGEVHNTDAVWRIKCLEAAVRHLRVPEKHDG